MSKVSLTSSDRGSGEGVSSAPLTWWKSEVSSERFRVESKTYQQDDRFRSRDRDQRRAIRLGQGQVRTMPALFHIINSNSQPFKPSENDGETKATYSFETE